MNQKYTSPDWVGEGWYRLEGKKKYLLYQPPQDENTCGADVQGWLKEPSLFKLPKVLGQEVAGTVCFRVNTDQCALKMEIKILPCDDGAGLYYLYYLKEVPQCSYRYCLMTL